MAVRTSPPEIRIFWLIKDEQITAGSTTTQKQVADINFITQQQISKLEQRVEVGLAKMEGDIKNLDTKFEEKTKNLEQRIISKEFTIRGITVTVLGGLLLAFGKFLFFGKI